MQQAPTTSNDLTQVSGARLFLGRLLETFFRRWWLYLVPIALLGALGATTVLGKGASYRAAGVILVNRDSLLNQITAVRGQTTFGFDSPATYTSRQFNTLLGTDSFVDSVITAAGLKSAVESGALTRQTVRTSLWAAAQGDELVVINAATSNPELSFRLADATMGSYVQWEIDNTISQSQSSEQFFESLLVPYQQKLDDARSDLATYVSAHPAAGTAADRPADEQVEIASLTEAVTRADDQLSTARSSLAAASLASAQSTTDVTQRLRIVDSPEQPTAPEPHRKKDALTLMLFLILGAIVSAAALVIATLLDRSVRYGDEIEAHLKVPVLATVPNSGGVVRTRIL
jgi:uncharacterized protein involved in exopolysaccharide biosynthesis